MVLALTARQWASLGEATGLTAEFAAVESRAGADFRNEADRWIHRRPLVEALQSWFARHDLAGVRKAFDSHGVLWGPYHTAKQLVADDSPASTINPMVSDIQPPGPDRFLTAGPPLRLAH